MGLEEETRTPSSLPCEDTAGKWLSVSQEEKPDQELNLPAPFLDFLVSATVRNKSLLFKLPSLW